MRIQTFNHSKLKTVCVIAALTMASLPGSLPAQVPAASITIVSPGLGCSTSAVANGFGVLSWKLGADAPPSTPLGSGGGGGFSRTAFSDVAITKSFDECSAALFKLLAAGSHLQTLTLTQSVGGVPKLTVVLGDSLVSSYELSGASGTPFPTEMVAFRYQKITITNLANGSKACFDSQTLKSC